MKNIINNIINDYNLDVEAKTGSFATNDRPFELSISLGNNEGYYVNIKDIDRHNYHLRTHSKDEALKILGCMLILLPNN